MGWTCSPAVWAGAQCGDNREAGLAEQRPCSACIGPMCNEERETAGAGNLEEIPEGKGEKKRRQQRGRLCPTEGGTAKPVHG